MAHCHYVLFSLVLFLCGICVSKNVPGESNFAKTSTLAGSQTLRDDGGTSLFASSATQPDARPTGLSLVMNSSQNVDELGEVLKKKVAMLQASDNMQLDIVFLVDASSSVGDNNFNSELKFVKKLLADFPISLNETRVAVITFSDPDKVVRHVDHISVPSSEFHKCSIFLDVLPHIKYLGGLTYTLGALVEAQSVLEWSRAGAQKAIFLVTDGFSNNGDPVPVAHILKGNGTKIFTFGIQSGNIKELESIASAPANEYSYFVDSFDQFQALVRRALHQDLSVGSYQLLNTSSPCDSLCTFTSRGSNGCCDSNAQCSCGTGSGYYRCLCNPGYYGSGLKNSCSACPVGTYHDGLTPGDESVCLPCPDPNFITEVGKAFSKASCTCKLGFVARGDRCEVVTCPPLYPPEHGYFVKGRGMCPNVFNAACGMRCEAGYTLHGSSIRLCQADGTWSGRPTKCIVKMCPNPEVPINGDVKCSLEPSVSNDLFHPAVEDTRALVGLYTVDTECEFSCLPGHILVGSRRRICLPLARWHGLRTVCKPVACPHLPKLSHGFITPEACTGQMKLPFGQKCSISCAEGYRLQGPSSRVCGGKAGQWSMKSTPSKCIDDQPPLIICPSDFEVTADSGESFSSVMIPLPKTSDNSGATPMLWSQPTISSPMKIPIGVLSIVFIAMDQSHNQASCNVTITVVDKEPPVIGSCLSPSPVHVTEKAGNHTVDWMYPEFHDNSGKKISVNVSYPHREFAVGKTDIIITAYDESGNNNTCILEVIVQDSPCSNQSSQPLHADIKCNAGEENLKNCSMTCHEGYAIDPSTLIINASLFIVNGTLLFACPVSEDGVHSVQDLALPACGEVLLPNSISQQGVVSFRANSHACEDHELLKKVTKLVEKHSEDLCKRNPDFSCHILYANTSCDELASLQEEETNLIHPINEVSFALSNSSEGDASLKVHYNHQPKKRETTSSQGSNIHVHFNVVSDLQREMKPDGKHQGSSNFNQLKESIRGISFPLPANIRGVSFSWKGKLPEVTCSAGTVLHSPGICVKCSSGYFFSNISLKCEPCLIGEYQTLEGQSRCLKCVKGMSTKFEGSRSVRDCLYLCHPGSFGKLYTSKSSHNVVSSTRTPVTGVSVSPCSLCSPGFYQPSYGATECLQCPAGSQALKIGARNLEDCFRSTEKKTLHPSRLTSCQSNLCQNGGTCQLISLGFISCSCPPGLYGSFCEIVFDYCISSPCLNGGHCSMKKNGGYSCLCPLGFGGHNCEEDINECSSNPCLNNSTCEDLNEGFYCDCPEGFQGSRCEENVDDCISNPCGDHGLCSDSISNFSCSCNIGHSGRNCEIEDFNLCLEGSPCLNGGSCESINSTVYGCACLPGWEGEHCQIPYDSCSSSPCLNNGTCIQRKGGKYFCQCTASFSGDNCQTRLRSDFVLHLRSASVTDYAVVDFPAQNLNEVTACLWLQSKDGLNYGTAFSYAVQNQFNTFTLTDYNGFVFYVNGHRVVTDVSANDGSWHHVCVLWRSHLGLWLIYLDGSLRDTGSRLSASSSVPGGGKFVLGQEQDSFGGSFSEAESFIGHIYRLDVWDYLLNSSEISDLAEECQQVADGSVIKWSDFFANTRGGVKVEDSKFCSECLFPDSPWHGSVTLEKASNGTFALYLCDDGFVIHGTTQQMMTRRCLKQGSWEGGKPVCVRRSCGFPGYLRGGTFVGRSFLFSESVRYVCHFGAQIIGSVTRVCQSDGKWSGQPPVCKGRDCSPIVAPENGTVKLSAQTSGIQLAVFSCNDGFHLDGAKILTCMHDGNWDETVPDCLMNVCPPPPKIQHALHQNNSVMQFKVMDIVQYECEKGYEMSPPLSGSIHCTKDGEWCPIEPAQEIGVKFPQCEPKLCPKPEQLENGMWVSKDSLVKDSLYYPNGSILTAQCEFDYKLSGPINKYCSDKVWWPLDITQCTKITCDTEELDFDLPHSFVHLSGEEVGDTFTLSCKENYQLTKAKVDSMVYGKDFQTTEIIQNGSLSWMCKSDGSWKLTDSKITSDEEEWLTCKRVENNITVTDVLCDQPKAPIFGYIMTENLQDKSNVGTALEVRCRHGFWLDGPPTIVCDQTGFWIGGATVCKPVTCQSPPQFDHMVVASSTSVGQTLQFGAMVTFSCLSGFQNQGDLSVRCQSTGKWSPLGGKCIKINT